MKIQILSDLHTEGGVNPLLKDFKPAGDVLVLAGDITNAKKAGLPEELFGNCGVPVIYVLGNHEYYGGNMESTLDHFKKWYETVPNFHLLENEAVEIDGVNFVGSTFWTFVRPSEVIDVGRFVNDFHSVRNNDVGKHNHRHLNSKQHIEYLLSEGRSKGIGRQVVVTHFPPSYQAQEARFKSSGLGSYFYNDEDKFVEKLGPDLWIYGHTHGNLRFNIGDVPVECNQMGYTGRNVEPCYKDFDLNYIVEI